MKELKIQVPEGHCIDQENSTFELIRFKKIEQKFPSSWMELRNVDGYYVTEKSSVTICREAIKTNINKNIFATEEQAKASLALAQLSQLKKIYREIEGDKIDWRTQTIEHVIVFGPNGQERSTARNTPQFLAFTKRETRDLFFDNFKELIEQARPLMVGE
jgi:hypothetical protein